MVGSLVEYDWLGWWLAMVGWRIGWLVDYGVCNILNYGLVGKHVSVIMKPSNSPTQGQPNPRKIRLKVAFGLLFPTANNFRGLGLILYRK